MTPGCRGPWLGFIVICSVGVIGCPDSPRTDEAQDAAVAEVVDAGPPVPSELVLSVTAESAQAGTIVLPLEAGSRPEVPQLSKLQITTNLPLQDYRIRVFDEADRAVVSDDSAEALPDRVRYDIVFPEPLKTGFRYTLVMDAQTGPQILDGLGRTHPDVRLEFRIAGEKEKPPPPKKKKRRR